MKAQPSAEILILAGHVVAMAERCCEQPVAEWPPIAPLTARLAALGHEWPEYDDLVAQVTSDPSGSRVRTVSMNLLFAMHAARTSWSPVHERRWRGVIIALIDLSRTEVAIARKLAVEAMR